MSLRDELNQLEAELHEFGEVEGEGELGEGEFGEMHEGGLGELGEAELGEGEFGNELGETGDGEFGERGELGEFGQGELGLEFGELGEAEGELTSQLLELRDEAELDRFLPLLLGPAMGALKALAPVAMKAATPLLKQAAGGLLSKVGGLFGRLFGRRRRQREFEVLGLETGGLSNEDEAYEVARRFVRLANVAGRAATSAVLRAKRSGLPVRAPQVRQIVARTVTRVVRRLAPGIPPVATTTVSTAGGSAQRGSWVRRGNQIVLFL